MSRCHRGASRQDGEPSVVGGGPHRLVGAEDGARFVSTFARREPCVPRALTFFRGASLKRRHRAPRGLVRVAGAEAFAVELSADA